VAEHRPVRSESLQPHTEWNSRPGQELSSVEADVYVWRYALLVLVKKKKQKYIEYRQVFFAQLYRVAQNKVDYSTFQPSLWKFAQNNAFNHL